MSVLVPPFVQADGGPELVAEIRDRRPALDITYAADETAARAAAGGAEIIVTHRLPPWLLDTAGRLEWVQALSAGTDAFDREALADADVALTSASGIHAKPIAQQVLGYLLYFERGFYKALAQQRENEWAFFGGRELGDRTVGLVGVGAIGSQVATYCEGFGPRLVAVKRDPSDAPDSLDAVHPPAGLGEVLPESDYLVIACPLTPETRGLIDAAAFGALPDHAVLVNVARGEIVDQAALVDALRRETIRGAALDVFAEEPLPATSPLWDRDDVLVTPHMAGSTPHYWERAAALFVDNLERYRRGDPLRNRVV